MTLKSVLKWFWKTPQSKVFLTLVCAALLTEWANAAAAAAAFPVVPLKPACLYQLVYSRFLFHTRIPARYQACHVIYQHKICSKHFTQAVKLYIPSTLITYLLATTMDCGCSKMLNHGLNQGLFLSSFSRFLGKNTFQIELKIQD